MKKQFNAFGSIVITKAVSEFMNKYKEFDKFLIRCLKKYSCCDWGDLCDDDRKMNDDALKFGERIFASYNLPSDARFNQEETRLWIITEWDRSVTTILFPSDY